MPISNQWRDGFTPDVLELTFKCAMPAKEAEERVDGAILWGLQASWPLVRKVRSLQLRQNNPLLMLILTLAIGIADFADFVGLKEQDLAQPFISINPCW